MNINTHFQTSKKVGKNRKIAVFHEDDDLGLYVLCGEPKDGDGANAKLVCDEIVKTIKANEQKLSTYNINPTPLGRLNIENLIRAVADHANLTLFKKQSESKKSKSRLPVSANIILLVNGYAFVSQVGDDQILLVRSGQVQNFNSTPVKKLSSLELGFNIEGLKETSEEELGLGRSQTIGISVHPMPTVSFDTFIMATAEDNFQQKILDQLKKVADDISTQDDPEKITKLILSLNIKNKKQSQSIDLIAIKLIERRERHQKSDISLEKQFTILQKIPIFKQIKERQEDLNRIHSLCFRKTFSKGEALMREGEESKDMFIVLTGEVEIFKEGALVYKCTSGTVIGEIGTFNEESRAFTAIATSIAEIMVLNGKTIFSMVQANPDFGLRLYAGVVNELSTKLKRGLGQQWE